MVAVAVLAAGKGTRMKSEVPKVLHPLAGKPLVERVIRSTQGLPVERLLVVVGHGADQVRQALAHLPQVEFVEQSPLLGTGHAVQQLVPYLEDYTGDLLVLNGDVPLLRPETLVQLWETHQQGNYAVTLLTALLADPTGYGRVICDGQMQVSAIIEDRDCTPAQRQNQRVNAGIYCFQWPKLRDVLPRLTTQNQQQEYYLTDAIQWLKPARAVDMQDSTEILGINDRKQLAVATQLFYERLRDEWLRRGVTMIDPDSVTIEDEVELAPDVVIEPQTHLRGRTVIGAGSHIGPNCWLENSTVGEKVRIWYSVVTNSVIAAGCQVGPFAHLRDQTQVGEHCRVGNFVEMKKTQVGPDCRVAHLSYLGDAQLGTQVNVGAGTITANFDGRDKHPTVIKDGCKLGANCVLVAPVTLGEGVTVAAGSVVTEDVPADALVIARARQVVKPGWRPPYMRNTSYDGGN
ncbi:MAG: bifunctional UDP-N-acetylglucosamine diphosphorylase/glucosamine-1-phosphate N-acetyltransferase GlmU [Gloeomargarita sp. SKYG116]|nr:bifunctional UDP-N-acetylglucosamine diphosphorylase/glucosamine-1-phosphate N-acetyltransferase GlmU [Gloeomargarita sp. SKYG116]MDW8401718.1 bifunctional UDP-N-acetylglucosamine diphosphorylase/glucosamine-1-phosphate N-acetyltransferase GlmU [Gloeomargarita sp. SKYGB_i_bin116]